MFCVKSQKRWGVLLPRHMLNHWMRFITEDKEGFVLMSVIGGFQKINFCISNNSKVTFVPWSVLKLFVHSENLGDVSFSSRTFNSIRRVILLGDVWKVHVYQLGEYSTISFVAMRLYSPMTLNLNAGSVISFCLPQHLSYQGFPLFIGYFILAMANFLPPVHLKELLQIPCEDILSWSISGIMLLQI